MKCTLNVPVIRPTKEDKRPTHPASQSSRACLGQTRCRREACSFGGLVVLAKHLECLGCYESVMGASVVRISLGSDA